MPRSGPPTASLETGEAHRRPALPEHVRNSAIVASAIGVNRGFIHVDRSRVTRSNGPRVSPVRDDDGAVAAGAPRDGVDDH
jgi:hypothetical protein